MENLCANFGMKRPHSEVEKDGDEEDQCAKRINMLNIESVCTGQDQVPSVNQVDATQPAFFSVDDFAGHRAVVPDINRYHDHLDNFRTSFRPSLPLPRTANARPSTSVYNGHQARNHPNPPAQPVDMCVYSRYPMDLSKRQNTQVSSGSHMPSQPPPMPSGFPFNSYGPMPSQPPPMPSRFPLNSYGHMPSQAPSMQSGLPVNTHGPMPTQAPSMPSNLPLSSNGVNPSSDFHSHPHPVAATTTTNQGMQVPMTTPPQPLPAPSNIIINNYIPFPSSFQTFPQESQPISSVLPNTSSSHQAVACESAGVDTRSITHATGVSTAQATPFPSLAPPAMPSAPYNPALAADCFANQAGLQGLPSFAPAHVLGDGFPVGDGADGCGDEAMIEDDYDPELTAQENPHYYHLNHMLYRAHRIRARRYGEGQEANGDDEELHSDDE